MLVALLAFFIVVAFFGLLWHVTNMVAGPPESEPRRRRIPLTCAWALLLAALPVVILGVWLPQGLAQALESAARVLGAA